MPATGGCLCGAVRYEVSGPLRDIVACHCGMCRRQTGSFVHATAARLAGFRLIEEGGLAWYRSSPSARRGFCRLCGSSLFWQADGRPTISIMAGSLDSTEGLALAEHICVAGRPGYYGLDDGLPQHDDDIIVAAIPESGDLSPAAGG
jgi:hypothetical protein